MTYRSKGGLGLTRLLVQTLFGLIVGVILSICALLVQIFLVLLGRRATRDKEISEDVSYSHASSCSLCMHRKRQNSYRESSISNSERNQSETSTSRAA